jgi:hypothetical protein
VSSDSTILALPDVSMTSAQVAEMLKLSPHTLEQMRVDDSGPPYLKAGGGQRSLGLCSRRTVAQCLSQFSFSNISQHGPKVILRSA